MKGLWKRFEQHMLAITFAEAGEFETARDFLREHPRPSKYDRLQKDSKEQRPRPQIRV